MKKRGQTMSITGVNGNLANISILQEVHRKNSPAISGKKVTSIQNAHEDTVFISDQSREFGRIKQLVAQQPDVRLNRTSQLSAEIDKGTYNIPGKTLADSVIRKHLIDLNS
jgi:negative regulator of flagellin synthesis FlgM